MFELVILIAIAGGIWFYMKSGEEVLDDVVAPEPQEAKAEEVEPVETEVEVATEVTEEEKVPAAEVESIKEPVVAKLAIEPTKSKFVAGMPEDSTLKRHYLQLVVANQAASNRIPEDAVLRRHFIQSLIAGVEATLDGEPSDSSLNRHYQTQVANDVMDKLAALK